jgi:hypothetical protein
LKIILSQPDGNFLCLSCLSDVAVGSDSLCIVVARRNPRHPLPAAIMMMIFRILIKAMGKKRFLGQQKVPIQMKLPLPLWKLKNL